MRGIKMTEEEYIALHTFIITDDARHALETLAEQEGLSPERMLEVLILEAHGPVLIHKRSNPREQALRKALYAARAERNQR